jgi:hypothetical protein
MKDIQILTPEKYNDTSRYEKVEEGIYRSLLNYPDEIVLKGQYVTTVSFTLEAEHNELSDRQYPLEDILDEYLAHVSDFTQDEPENPVMILELCTQEWLDAMQRLVQIAGKHIYNRVVEKNGEELVELVIE